MEIKDFDYFLPEGLIAQVPAESRDNSRLLVVSRKDRSFIDDRFYNIHNYFSSGDMLILNNTKVVPCRINGEKRTGGKIEIFLLKKIEGNRWECFLKSNKKVLIGQEIYIGKSIKCTVSDKNDSFFYLEFDNGFNENDMEKIGTMPVPPYIKRRAIDKELLRLDYERYQTVYAKSAGAVAAPTAGLHFSPELIEKIVNKGVKIIEITLHTGAGTFLPVKTENVEEHKMMEEYFSVGEDIIAEIRETQKNGKKVIAVGTTSARALETVFLNVNIGLCYGYTDLFIYPGFTFRAVDFLVTNFHLPKSTLLLLVSAFAGKELIFKAYEHAVENKYRFYSYGDGMLIV